MVFQCLTAIKLFDYIFIELNTDSLKTDDMQFGFKRNHSTVLCSAIYIETINHYVNEGSNVYSCLIDASKAFDRVHWRRLFKILILRETYLLSLSDYCWIIITGMKKCEKISDIFLTKYKNLFNSVPTNDIEMTNICSTFRNDVVHADDIRITVDIIKTCIKNNKMLSYSLYFWAFVSDGKHGFNSDHLIHVQIVCLSFSASCLILC